MSTQRWAGVALGGTASPGAGMASRLPAYLHPLAGRPLCWHVLTALRRLEPPPEGTLLVTPESLTPEIAASLDADVVVRGEEAADALGHDLTGVLLVDAAAPNLGDELGELLAGGPGASLVVGDRTVAAFLRPPEARERLSAAGDPLGDLPPGSRRIPLDPAAIPLVDDRSGLARAVAVMRDCLVRRHMEAGVTFLLPDTVLLDVEVTIGRDTIVYPGVVLEGNSSIGEETVIGPGCRIIDSRIGSGVELKGWNYVARTSVRNRAILEPYVRRGFE